MDEQINMNNLAIKFLNSIGGWIDRRITERTKECLRTKIAIILDNGSIEDTYDIILAGDYGRYLELGEEREISNEYETLEAIPNKTKEQEDRFNELKIIIETTYNGEILTQELYEKSVSMLTINDLITIKQDSYGKGDYVVIGYVDNKLTNSFILYKNTRRGV